MLGIILSYVLPINTKNLALEAILDREEIHFNYKKRIRKFYGSYYAYWLFLKIYKPKMIFVNCHYDRFGLMKAANTLGIQIIEVQHGVINDEHYAYRSVLALDQDYYPDMLLSFGENEVALNRKIIPEVFPIGNFYLEYIEKNFSRSVELTHRLKPYKFTIGISLQDADWERDLLLGFLTQVAAQDSNIAYVLIPRKRKDIRKNLPSNIWMYTQLDCYNIIMHCNAHCTLYSTCALEAPTLGIPNILIDLNGVASRYYGKLLSANHTKYAKDSHGFFEALDKIKKLDTISVKQFNQNLFAQDNARKLEKLLGKIHKNR
jgi:hypothetical protein